MSLPTLAISTGAGPRAALIGDEVQRERRLMVCVEARPCTA
jgi:hypothetical protein